MRDDDCSPYVAGGGDLTGNATDDFVFGCPGEGAGTLHVIDGDTTYEVPDVDGIYVDTGDFNGDGQRDVVAGASTVLLVEGPITTTSAAPLVDERLTGSDLYYEVRAVGDVDDDGYDDLVSAGRGGDPSMAWLYPGAASAIMSGGFSLSRYMSSAVGGDFDGDGDDDLALVDNEQLHVAFGPVTESPHWETVISVGGFSLAAGDLDDDGVDDLVVGAGTGSDAVFVFLGGSL